MSEEENQNHIVKVIVDDKRKKKLEEEPLESDVDSEILEENKALREQVEERDEKLTSILEFEFQKRIAELRTRGVPEHIIAKIKEPRDLELGNVYLESKGLPPAPSGNAPLPSGYNNPKSAEMDILHYPFESYREMLETLRIMEAQKSEEAKRILDEIFKKWAQQVPRDQNARIVNVNQSDLIGTKPLRDEMNEKTRKERERKE